MTDIASISPAMFGFNVTGGGSGGLPSGLETSQVSQSAPLAAPAYSPDNPMFWFALLLVGGAALIVYSGRVRLGVSAHAGAVHASAGT